jgi:nucleotide sugar dehydrogenase
MIRKKVSQKRDFLVIFEPLLKAPYMVNQKIGFIGQGMVGKNMADDFEERGFDIVRYSLEPEYIENKEGIRDCNIVFIAVPTPTTPQGFDNSILKKEIKLVGKGQLAVIKSTVLPGTTEMLSRENPEIHILHSPEFLIASRASEGVRKPERNLIGMPSDTRENREHATTVLSVLPKAPYQKILLSKETELIKYIGNNFLYTKVVFMNLMYDLSLAIGAEWQAVAEAVSQDRRIGASHINPVHESIAQVTKSGRGAGGYCFPKDFEALLQFYKETLDDNKGVEMLEAIREKNIELLVKSDKDMKIIRDIYDRLLF